MTSSSRPGSGPKLLRVAAGVALVLALAVTERTLSGPRLRSLDQPAATTQAPAPYRVGGGRRLRGAVGLRRRLPGGRPPPGRGRGQAAGRRRRGLRRGAAGDPAEVRRLVLVLATHLELVPPGG